MIRKVLPLHIRQRLHSLEPPVRKKGFRSAGQKQPARPNTASSVKTAAAGHRSRIQRILPIPGQNPFQVRRILLQSGASQRTDLSIPAVSIPAAGASNISRRRPLPALKIPKPA